MGRGESGKERAQAEQRAPAHGLLTSSRVTGLEAGRVIPQLAFCLP